MPKGRSTKDSKEISRVKRAHVAKRRAKHVEQKPFKIPRWHS